MRSRDLTQTLIGTTFAALLAACNYGGDPVAGDGETHETVPTLQQAASDALTPRAQRRSHLVSDPGPGRLTPERIHAEPAIDGPSLMRARIAPSGDFVTVLKGREDDADQLDLWAYDLDAGAGAAGEGRLLVSSTDLLGAPEELSEEEKNRRERQRLYARGIVDYSWAGDQLLMFPLGGDIYLFDLETGEPRQVTATPAFETDPKVSADGALVAYVREDELYVTDLASGLERQLTDSATDTVRNATASFVVQEELDRDTGYWIAPDASAIAYTQIDESPIAVETRANIGPDGITTIDQRYPFAGTDNATVRLGVVPTRGGDTVWADLGNDPDIYLTRVAWAPDGDALYAGILSRDNKTHTVYRVDAATGESDVFFEETSPTWLNIRSGFTPIEGGFRMVSERDGMRRYYEITPDGARALTPEGVLVQDILCEADDGKMFLTGWRESPVSTHIFRIETQEVLAHEDGQGGDASDGQTDRRAIAVQIDQGEGQHSAAFNADCTRYLETFSSDDTPPQVRAFEADGTPLAWLSENRLDADHPYAPYLDAHIAPEYGTLAAEDGSELHYQLYKPLDLQPGQRRASVTIVYGGPGVQRVMNRWQRKHLPRMLAHHGFVVFLVDGRGSSNRGKAFEDVLDRALGRAEVVDQTVGAQWLKAQPFIDPDRMGVYGWSYGGYMTLMMLGQTDLYASGVAGAPVTDWALYDTAYTERYLGDPRPDHPNHTPGAYEGGSVFTHLDGLTEPVLVIHGMADDNVVFRHTVKLVDALQKRGRHNFELEAYPGEKHGFRAREARIHRDRSILEFFLNTLDLDEEG
ncbi:MAG: DPP IV N-terminal domain-containing protein [Pseudomonadota bacterium]